MPENPRQEGLHPYIFLHHTMDRRPRLWNLCFDCGPAGGSPQILRAQEGFTISLFEALIVIVFHALILGS